MVPHLTTALAGPLLELEKKILTAMPEIEQWFRTQWQDHPAPFYTSVDLRNAGFKLAPVDTNLFPGGFNNLNPDFLPLAVQAAMSSVEHLCPEAKRMLIIPESHTRNTFYLRNVGALTHILRKTGLEVRIGTLIPEIGEPTRLDLSGGQEILLEPLVRRGQRLGLADFDPCAILLNNDLSAGTPAILEGLRQPVIPPLHAGWSVRRKTHHFTAYNQVAEGFARLAGIDSWLINPLFAGCGKVDFREKQGFDCLAEHTDSLLGDIREKYREHGVTQTPFVVIKADAGTYGMGVMMVKDAAELREINRNQRKKMAVVKEGLEVREVMIQEGVHTFETINDAVAEPVVYMMDHFVIGGFYRVHTARRDDENLNSPGMHFVPLAFETSCILPDRNARPDAIPNRFYTYGVVARLAMLAAAIELEETNPATGRRQEAGMGAAQPHDQPTPLAVHPSPL
jgi:glutamate--cysteine ligase